MSVFTPGAPIVGSSATVVDPDFSPPSPGNNDQPYVEMYDPAFFANVFGTKVPDLNSVGIEFPAFTLTTGLPSVELGFAFGVDGDAGPIPRGVKYRFLDASNNVTPLGVVSTTTVTSGTTTYTSPTLTMGPGTYRLQMTSDAYTDFRGVLIDNIVLTGILLGDFNKDAVVNAADIDLLCDAIDTGGLVSLYDVNADGSVTSADLKFEVETVLSTSFGDSDTDGDVDLADLGNLASGFGQPGEKWWSRGNFDCDDDVDLNDLGTLASNFEGGREAALAHFDALVPEPSVGAVTLALLAGTVRCRRRSM